jgi:hypothetical protein
MSATHSYLPPAHHSHPSIARASLKAAAIAATAAALTTAALHTAIPSHAASASASSMATLPMTERVVGPRRLENFVPVAHPAVVSTPTAWATTTEHMRAPSQETSRLHRLGFVSGIDEQLLGLSPLKARGSSLVERFRSAAGARAELAYQYKHQTAGANVTSYRVVGIPGARSWIGRRHGTTAINVSFAVGSYYYRVGSQFPTGSDATPSRGSINSAASGLYLLVNGCVSSHLGS